jgi:hypothetical protein
MRWPRCARGQDKEIPLIDLSRDIHRKTLPLLNHPSQPEAVIIGWCDHVG